VRINGGSAKLPDHAGDGVAGENQPAASIRLSVRYRSVAQVKVHQLYDDRRDGRSAGRRRGQRAAVRHQGVVQTLTPSSGRSVRVDGNGITITIDGKRLTGDCSSSASTQPRRGDASRRSRWRTSHGLGTDTRANS